MEAQEAVRRAMSLSALDPDNDKIIKQGRDFATRKILQNQVMKTTIAEKPDGPQLWATEKTAANAAGPIPKCHMQVTVVNISATVPRGNTDGSDIADIPKEVFIPRELAGEWSIASKIIGCMSHPKSGMQSQHSSRSFWQNMPPVMHQGCSKKSMFQCSFIPLSVI